MQLVLKFIMGLAVMIVAAAGAAWIAWRALKKSHDPGSLIVKWIITGAAFVFMVGVVAALGIYAAMVAAVIGVLLGVMWAPNIAAVVAKPLTSFYDGGDVEPEERPFYSIARAKQKQGKYQEAIV